MSVRSRILVVDDEPDILDLFAEILSHQYDLDACCNVAQAKNLLQSKSYGLVITDLAMPGAMGTELIDFAKEARLKIPILIVSGLLEIDKHGLEPGTWLSKPFRRQELLDKVAELVKIDWG